jgi:hypothetical protein
VCVCGVPKRANSLMQKEEEEEEKKARIEIS